MSKRSQSTSVGILLGIVLALVVGLVYALTQNVFALLGVLGVYLSIVISLLFTQIERLRHLQEQDQVAAALAADPTVGRFCQDAVAELEKARRFGDGVYEELLGQTLDGFRLTLARVASGVVEFQAEAWRRPWQQLLSQRDVKFYYSAALVKSPAYWQDSPGKSCMQFNQSVASRLKTKRIFVIWDHVWDDPDMRRWIADQKASGIDVAVVRRSEIPPTSGL